MKKIIVTGGAGFIGSNIALTLQERFPEADITVIDNFSSGSYENLIGFQGDVVAQNVVECDFKKYFGDGVDAIFHEGAITDTTVFDQQRMMRENVEGFRNVLVYALKHNARLVYASSAAIYGHSRPPMKVGANETPANIYGFSKFVVDNIARKYFAGAQAPIIGLRYFNVYGPGEKYKGKMASMIWQLGQQMKRGQRPRIFKDGEQKRDQVYIKDVVAANMLALDATKSGIVNVGTGKATSFNEIVGALNHVLKTSLEPDYIENPYAHYQDYTEADITTTMRALGYAPQYDVVKGVGDYFAATNFE
jgi:ADP-L-glycero-D-manno-heptose 6-epimerase